MEVSGKTLSLYPKIRVRMRAVAKILKCFVHLKTELKTVRSGLKKGDRHLITKAHETNKILFLIKQY
jgi:hypothetical protein